jgi:hypothetical protein
MKYLNVNVGYVNRVNAMSVLRCFGGCFVSFL